MRHGFETERQSFNLFFMAARGGAGGEGIAVAADHHIGGGIPSGNRQTIIQRHIAILVYYQGVGAF